MAGGHKSVVAPRRRPHPDLLAHVRLPGSSVVWRPPASHLGECSDAAYGNDRGVRPVRRPRPVGDTYSNSWHP
jgi:hypothetical protein